MGQPASPGLPTLAAYDLNVYATTKDGIQLTPYDYFFTVN